MRAALVVIVVLTASGPAWAAGWWCSSGRCSRDLSTCRPNDPDCHVRDRAACVYAHAIIADSEREDCADTMTGCEDVRNRMLADHEVDQVTRCRVVDADDLERSERRWEMARSIGGAALAIGGIIALLRPWTYFRR